jgi:hypothetical protein
MKMNFEAPVRLIFWPDYDGAIKGQDFPTLTGALAVVRQDRMPRVHWIVTGNGDIIKSWHIASLLTRHHIRIWLSNREGRSNEQS